MKKNKAGKHENRRIGASQKKRPVSKTFYRNCYFPAISFPRTHHSRSLRIPDFFSSLNCFVLFLFTNMTWLGMIGNYTSSPPNCFAGRRDITFQLTQRAVRQKKKHKVVFYLLLGGGEA